MKIQCSVCELAEANVLCCPDEAALCWSCDEKVHAANKLASKHQRVHLFTSSSQIPKCDICQETVGYFFCLEDRALLCRRCDVAIHTVNNYVSAHQRFLLTGVKVGLEPAEPGPSSSSRSSHSVEKAPEIVSRDLPRIITPLSLDRMRSNSHCSSKDNIPMSSDQFIKAQPVQVSSVGEYDQVKLPLGGGSAAESIPLWQLDELLGINDFNQHYGFMDNGTSKADSGKLGNSDSSPNQRAIEEELDGDECLGQVPDSYWAAQIPSPPTASGLYWPNDYQNPSESAAFVPDISYSPLQNLNPYNQTNCSSLKRRRQF